ncbi:MAG: hypothetical protein IJ282_11520 [Lachnospiraceae bacterium]|nr:hypothetical protein [Lachnospiraceae bacterium]
MKKLFIPVIILAMAFCLCACDNSGINKSEKTLYDHGLEVISLMVEVTRSEEYIEALTGSGAMMEVVQSIGTGDFATPKAVYSITVDDGDALKLLELDNLKGVSEELKSHLRSRVFGSLITQVNSLCGAEKLAASSICAMGKTFVDNGATENVIYIYTYENALPVAVTFTIGEDGAVSAGGNFIMYEEFTCDSAEEIEEFFSELYLDVVVSEVDYSNAHEAK